MFELPSHLHPMVVHFPIALFITALGFEMFGLIFKREDMHKNAVQIYILAALITPLILRTGMWEAERLHLNHPLLDQHRTFALWTMWVSLGSLPILYLFKEQFVKYFKIIFLMFLVTIVSFVSLTADKGGDMVYEYGVGVEE